MSCVMEINFLLGSRGLIHLATNKASCLHVSNQRARGFKSSLRDYALVVEPLVSCHGLVDRTNDSYWIGPLFKSTYRGR